MARERLASEVLFERYLSSHGYEWEHEPDLSIDKAPDYRVRRGGVELVCEVKEFATQEIRNLGNAGGPVAVPHALLYRTIRNHVLTLHNRRDPGAAFDAPTVVGGVPNEPYVHVLDTCNADAVPLPPTVFDGGSDARWSPDELRRWRQAAGVVRPGGVPDPDALPPRVCSLIERSR